MLLLVKRYADSSHVHEMLTAAMYGAGLILTATTIPWSTVMKGVTIAWELFSAMRGKVPEPTVEILVEAIASVISDRQRLPHVDLFCRLAGWSWGCDGEDPSMKILVNVEKTVAGYVLAGDVRLTLTEIFNEIEHLTTEYIRSGFQLGGLGIGDPAHDSMIQATFPYWCSLGESDRQALLDQNHAKNYIDLLGDLELNHQRQRDLLHRWLVSRSSTIKLICKVERLADQS